MARWPRLNLGATWPIINGITQNQARYLRHLTRLKVAQPRPLTQAQPRCHMAYHKWSNLQPTLNDYRAILSCHVAQSSCFNHMVEKIYIWQNISKNPNDVMCHIFRLPCVNILVCTIVANVVVSVVARIHPWMCIKSSCSYSTKKYFICHLHYWSPSTCRLLLC